MKRLTIDVPLDLHIRLARGRLRPIALNVIGYVLGSGMGAIPAAEPSTVS
jgi:hypothetical protein